MTEKEKLVEELYTYLDFFEEFNLETDKSKLMFAEESYLKDKLYGIKTIKRNRERLNQENLNN